MMRNSDLLNKRGLTLIEILVAMTILAFVSMFIYYVIISSFEVNRKLSRESDVLLTLSIGTQAIERDITQMYSPPLGETKAPEVNTPDTFWSAQQRADGLRRTRFIGAKEKMSFIAASNRRLQADVKESELAKIIWEIIQEKDGSYSISRWQDTDVFNYDDANQQNQGINKYKVIEKLQSAAFYYYNSEKNKWEESWDSEAPYIAEESRYPTLVAVEFQYHNPENESNLIKWRSEFMPLLKLNADKKIGVGATSGK